MTSYYNEFDPYAAQWLRNLIAAGHIAPGDVDERSITEVCADDLKGYTQCHFFAGIGVWSYALRRAGWPDDMPIWTGSCPCQPWSEAGNHKGSDDERHLYPVWAKLIRECRPGIVTFEQVASKKGLVWLDLVQDDLEAANYAVGTVDLCAAGFGAAHLRQRLYGFAAYSGDIRVPRPRYSNSAGEYRQRGPDSTLDLQQIVASPFSQGRRWSQPLLRKGIDEFTGWVGQVRAYGNALDAETATQFCAAMMETLNDMGDALSIL